MEKPAAPFHHVLRPCREGEQIPDVVAYFVPVEVETTVEVERTIEIEGQPVVLNERVPRTVIEQEVRFASVTRPARHEGEILVNEFVPLTAEELQEKQQREEFWALKKQSVRQILKLEEGGMGKAQRKVLIASSLPDDDPDKARAIQVEAAIEALRQSPEFAQWWAIEQQRRADAAAAAAERTET
jgi:hypothetical protein